MVSIQTLVDHLSDLLRVQEFDDVITNGLQVEGTRDVRLIATAVSVSQYAIDQANAIGADLLITHHGLWRTRDRAVIRGHVRARLAALLGGGLHLLSYHLPLDAHVDLGNAWPAAAALGWNNRTPFGRYGQNVIGVQGSLGKQSQPQDVLRAASAFWGSPGVLVSGQSAGLIQTCALVTGKGCGFLQEAVDAGIDCFITGTGDEETWHMVHEYPIHLMTFGHFATERLGVQRLGDHLAKQFAVGHHFIDQPNPF